MYPSSALPSFSPAFGQPVQESIELAGQIGSDDDQNQNNHRVIVKAVEPLVANNPLSPEVNDQNGASLFTPLKHWRIQPSEADNTFNTTWDLPDDDLQAYTEAYTDYVVSILDTEGCRDTPAKKAIESRLNAQIGSVETRLHTGKKRHKCEKCEKRFRKPCELKEHYRTHTGEKPYQCDECSISFAARFNLKRHQRTHTGEKPYQCNTCGMRFARKRGMKSKAHQLSCLNNAGKMTGKG